MDKPTCKNCKWWRPTVKPWAGMCRRKAPCLVDAEMKAVWPITKETMDCGEHTPKQEEPNDDQD